MGDITVLPLDIILNICIILEEKDIVRLGATCKGLYWATQNSVIWRALSLELWGFCNISTVEESKYRWKFYYLKRRGLELKMDAGKSGNYQAKTLRGHEMEITDTIYIDTNTDPNDIDCITGVNCVSCSLDCTIHVWDIAEGNTLAMAKLNSSLVSITLSPNGKYVFTGDVTGNITCLTVPNLEMVGGVETNNPIIGLQHLTHPNKKSTLLVSTHKDGAIMTWLEFDLKITTGSIPEMFKMQYCGQLIHDKRGLSLLPYKDNSLCVILVVNASSLAIYDIKKMFDATCKPEDSFITNLDMNNAIINGGWLSSLEVPYFVSLTVRGLELFKVEVSKIIGGQDLYPLISVNLDTPSTCLAICHNSHLLVGNSTGSLHQYSLSTNKTEIKFNLVHTFNDHRGSINSVYSTEYRVMTCSSDFSIRVYVWQKPQKFVKGHQLLSKYTLLGGSLARNPNPNFTQVIHNEMSCVGTNGKLLKAYTFKN